MRVSLDRAHIFASDPAATVQLFRTMFGATVVWDEVLAGARVVRLQIGRGKAPAEPGRWRSSMPRYIAAVLLVLTTAYCRFAFGNDTYEQVAASGLRETRELVSSELFGHYDVTSLAVLSIEPLQGRSELQQDYGLATVTVTFSTKRNATRHPDLNPALFGPGSPMCKGLLYLHCGVPVGHVFDGKLRLPLAADRSGRCCSEARRSHGSA